MNFTKSNKQRQIRKKVIDEDSNDKNNDNDNNKELNEVNNDDAIQPTKSIITNSSISGNKKKSNTFSTKKSTGSGSGGKAALNLFSFDEDSSENNDIENSGSSSNISGSIKVNPIALKRNDIQFEDSKAVSMKSESLGQYTNEILDNLKKTTTSKPIKLTDKQDSKIAATTDNGDNDKMEIDDKKYTDNSTQSTSVYIPNAEQIKLAKEKRLRARDGKFESTSTTSTAVTQSTSKALSKNFLPLKVTDNDEDSELNSRLVREDDDDEDVEEYNIKSKNTIKFGDPGKQTKKDIINNSDIDFQEFKSIKKSTTDQNLSDDEEFEDEDEEIKRWRLELIRKGGGNIRNQQQQQHDMQDDYQRKKIERELLLGPVDGDTPYKSSPSFTNIVTGTTSSPKISGAISYLELVLKDLNLSLNNLNEVKYSHQSELEKVQEALRDSVIHLSTLESNQHLSQDQAIFYDELKEYANNMTDCLGEKIPQIEKLEDRYNELLKDHAHDLRKQQRLKIQDHIDEIQENETESNIKSIINGRGDEMKDDNDNLDEFGRDRTYFEKSSRHKRFEQYKLIGNVDNEDQGDETLLNQSDEKYYLDERNKVLELIKQVMIDVDIEYSDINSIKEKFEHWKSKDLKSYQKAQMPFIMPSIFAPFVRLQMIEWSPLSNITFDSLKWYSDLFSYGLNDNSNSNQEDQDNNLIPKLIEKIVIPKIELYITFIWDPFSKRQTDNLVNCIDELLLYIDKEDQDIKLLFSQILSTIKYTINDSISLIPYSNKDLSFSFNYFKKCIDLLSSISKWSKFTLQLSHIKINQLIEFSDEIINISILPFLNKLIINNNTNNINNLLNLFDQYLINLQWSNKKYKQILDTFINQLSNNSNNNNNNPQ